MLSSAILCELNETVAEAKSIFQKWMLHNETIDPTIKEVVYTAGIKFGGMQEWQFCWNAYNTTHDINERQLLLKALGQPRGDPWLLQRYDSDDFFFFIGNEATILFSSISDIF